MSDQKATKAALFAPKVTLTQGARNRHLRTSLLIGTIALVTSTVLGLWLLFFQTDNNISIDLNAVTSTEDGRLELQGLTYRGKTASGEPFAFHAKKASEDATNPNFVNLTTIDGTVDNKANGQITLSSQQGRFDQIENFVTLIGDVVITQSAKQLVFTTQRLTGDLDEGHFNAPQAVAVKSPASHISGESMTVTDFGDRVVFKGQTKAVISEESN